MSLALSDVIARAQHLVATGDLAGAQEVLDAALATVDPQPAQASPEVATAAGLQASVMVARGDPAAARPWAAFACAATRQLFGPHDERAIAATATLAAVLHRVGSHARAIHLYREVITELVKIDGPTSLRVLAAHADLATVEYARGQCDTARRRLHRAWQLHQSAHGEGHPAGIKMLARLGTMQRDCGQTAEAQRSLSLARELSQAHLPAEHPLAIQVAALTDAPARRRHTCEPSTSAEPAPWPTDRPGPREPASSAEEPTPAAATAPPTTPRSTSTATTAPPTAGQPIAPIDLYPLLDPSPPPSRRATAPPPEPDGPDPWWPPELTGLGHQPSANGARPSAAGPAPTTANPPPAPSAAAPPPPVTPAPPFPPPPRPARTAPPPRPAQPIVTAALIVILVIAITVIVGLLVSTDEQPANRESSPPPPVSPAAPRAT